MLKILDGNGDAGRELIAQLKRRGGKSSPEIEQTVAEIVAEVRERGDAAVREYTMKFDGSIPEPLKLGREEMKAAAQGCKPAFLAALDRASANIRDFHERQKQQSWFTTGPDGVMMGQRVRGLRRVGIYVPGGTAAYPSSVLMNAIPAKIAGVGEIVMATPPGKNGKPNPNILAAAYTAGVDRIFQIGGAQAVAALAFGTETVPTVDKIVGPGNIYVATAKKQLYGTVGIDMVAGPSEILILADETANPVFLAADLMSQAEHDVLASAVLLTTSRSVAEKTVAEISRQIQALSRRELIEKSLENYGAVVVCKNMEDAVAFANELAPEHLELCVERPMEYLGRIDNAGSVFLGEYSPEPLGDYFAGPNHVLPTSGTARFCSPLSVDSFVKKSSFLYYTPKALNSAKSDIITLARTEGLTAHANSIEVRDSDGVSSELENQRPEAL
ncbi:histidinol dehydrogenase [Caproiciproducens sp. NJN-50]|uniref:histidinol dehydrogenase n=1 Tax=Acutalibacteraceae TaxID=3082771 RepID=UPI000FFE03EA|nr:MULTISPECIES: histidinol dehydrogenase [Acutalibacteraceae]QAT49743.1 histidinol dehydrogenase [Caproiciproducens sp. NJN-50]